MSSVIASVSVSEILADVQRDLDALRGKYFALLNENRRLREQTDNRKKLTKPEVNRIRSLHANGWTQREIATAFDINPSTASRIVRGFYWA